MVSTYQLKHKTQVHVELERGMSNMTTLTLVTPFLWSWWPSATAHSCYWTSPPRHSVDASYKRPLVWVSELFVISHQRRYLGESYSDPKKLAKDTKSKWTVCVCIYLLRLKVCTYACQPDMQYAHTSWPFRTVSVAWRNKLRGRRPALHPTGPCFIVWDISREVSMEKQERLL